MGDTIEDVDIEIQKKSIRWKFWGKNEITRL